MVSASYVVLETWFFVKLLLDVLRLRRQYYITYGDGGFSELQVALRILENAKENIPLALFLLVVMEMNGADIWMLHVCGLFFLIGQIVHWRGTHHSIACWRNNGMRTIITSLIGMTIINLLYLPWDLILTLH